MDGPSERRDPQRFRDPAIDDSHVVDVVLIVCPQCSDLARVARFPAISSTDPPASWAARVFGARRLTCSRCPVTKSWPAAGENPASVAWYRDGRDPFFGLDLWLRTACCGSTLWAYNPEHLHLLRDWVGSEHRERGSQPPAHVGNRGDRWESESLLERLPAWITSRKHRDEVLRAVDHLLRSVPTPA